MSPAIKDRSSNRVSAAVAGGTDARTLRRFVAVHLKPGAEIFSDEHSAYRGLRNHKAVKALGGAVRPGPSAYQRHRVILGTAQAWVLRHLSQDEPQALAALRGRVCRQAQRPQHGHHGADAECGAEHGSEAVAVQGSGGVGGANEFGPKIAA